MKRTLPIFAFFLALGIGLVVAAFFIVKFDTELAASDVSQSAFQSEVSCLEATTLADSIPEYRDLPSFSILDFPEFPNNFFDVHNTNGIVRKSETVARSGEEWLVMFERKGKYEIRRSVARIKQLSSVSYAGDEADARVSFKGSGRPIFAFRNIKNVAIGNVQTVYLNPTWEEISRRNLPIGAMASGFKRDLTLNENWYTLRVSIGQSTEGEKIGVLVLENNGITQIIARNAFEEPYGTTIGNLLWAGDIDRDGKLDLYFDEFNEKGYFAGGLYLSSDAADGGLVKQVASFSYGGC